MKSRVDRAGKKVWSSTREKKGVIALCNCTIAHPPPTKSLEPLSFPSIVYIVWLRPFWWNVESSRNLFPQISRYIFACTNLYALLNTWLTLSSIIRRSHRWVSFRWLKWIKNSRHSSFLFFFSLKINRHLKILFRV